MREYYRLIKPGIVYGNILTALAAFIFAADRHISPALLSATLVGLACVIASACVSNNILDRDIDLRMERTKGRAIARGQVSVRSALVFAVVLGVVGFATLAAFTNLLTVAVAAFGVSVYLGLYTPLKRISPHSTIVGALAGAVPPVVGYVAVANALDTTATLLFLILVCWQMVHFFAIALFRLDDYRGAGLPVMPVQVGTAKTKVLMLTYTLLFALALFALYAVDHLGPLYVWPMGFLSLAWLFFGVSGFFTKNTLAWARGMFFSSLVVLLVFSLSLALS